MLTPTLKDTFIKVLTDMKLYKEGRDQIDVDADLIEVTHSNGKIYSFYFDPANTNVEGPAFQLSFIDDQGKKTRAIIHSETDEADVRSAIRKAFM